MSGARLLTNKLLKKIVSVFFLLVVLMGVSYIFTTLYFTNKHFEERSQKLNSELANHLIEEKFQGNSPFLEDGSVNKSLFGDLMHDMMAVNRGIEVYLLSTSGEILYSVVLSHDNPDDPAQYVDLDPVNEFINTNGGKYILGDDPRQVGKKKIFSAARFNHKGREGYIYIVLAGQEIDKISSSLFSSYFMRLGVGASIITMVFVLFLGIISIWFLTKNLRSIIYTVGRFQEGDLKIRIDKAEKNDLSILAINFNEMADTIEKNMEEIKSVDVLRRELIANVSHDLRTPLSIINGYIETLQIKKADLSEVEIDKYLSIIKTSSEKLARLVSQLFEYSKLEAKQVEPLKEPFSITDLAMDLVSKYQMLGEEKDVKIELKAQKGVPLVFADISLVERALQNLLDNALKFTSRGGSVSLSVSSNNEQVKVGISDTGPGINEHDQSMIFDRYRQAKKNSNQEGIGLGLAIVKKIMELHNTTIKVVSSPNEGSTFEFYLPKYQVSGA
ncbi:HAMP domain-containing sensor histidine kinase [Ekhidna sp.]|uniref:sensor histidine kinase n=1 Tax=Ekhidna sp. TaxID=2608089 RepID=UPI003296F41E